MIDALRAADGVDDVELTGDWVDRVGAVLASLRAAAWALLFVLGVAAIWVVAATLRLRMEGLGLGDEHRVARLLGAAPRFTRVPALVAGAAQGALGAVLALGVAWGLWRGFADRVVGSLAHAMGGGGGFGAVSFLAVGQAMTIVAVGAGLGLVGGALARPRARARRIAGAIVGVVVAIAAGVAWPGSERRRRARARGPARARARAEHERVHGTPTRTWTPTVKPGTGRRSSRYVVGQMAAQWDAAKPTRAVVEGKLGSAPHQRAARIRAAYRVLRADGDRRLWVEPAERMAAARRRPPPATCSAATAPRPGSSPARSSGSTPASPAWPRRGPRRRRPRCPPPR